MKHIGSNAFSFCTSLKEVEMPATITELESYAFAECTSLRRAVMPANSNLLGEQIFQGCVNLRELVEPSATPPKFDCDSGIFDDSEKELYENCDLIVKPGSLATYRIAPGWRRFPHFLPHD